MIKKPNIKYIESLVFKKLLSLMGDDATFLFKELYPYYIRSDIRNALKSAKDFYRDNKAQLKNSAKKDLTLQFFKNQAL